MRTRQASDTASASLVLGIVGVLAALLPLLTAIDIFLFAFLILIPVFAVVTGNRAKRVLPEASGQASVARAGVVLGVVALVVDGFWIFWLLARLGDSGRL